MTIFTKHHGLGNDFLVVFDLPDEIDRAKLAQQICDRRRGIGADGLLSGQIDPKPGLDAVMVLHNADGSRAEMSGNGIRCFAQAVYQRTGRARLTITTDAGMREVELAPTDDPATIMATVDMGPVERVNPPSNWDRLGTNPDRPVAHLSLGNPHSVVGVDDVAEPDLALLGAAVPDVNLEVVAPTSRPDTVRMRVHERGVGITEACGTGACAAAFAAHSWGLATATEGSITVEMDGGSAVITLDAPAPGRVTLTGPATRIAAIEIDL